MIKAGGAGLCPGTGPGEGGSAHKRRSQRCPARPTLLKLVLHEDASERDEFCLFIFN